MSLVCRIPTPVGFALKRTVATTTDPPVEKTPIESKAEELVVTPIEWPELDSKGRVPPKPSDGFRKFFLMPVRKLRAQMLIESLTGRAPKPVRFRPDFNSRLEATTPRKTLMEPTQNWCDVWPSAATFKHSVVPLPLRMGFRKNPLIKAPTPAEANLELMKIPNFLHLSPVHIAQHCEAIKKFCTPFPKELLHGTRATKTWDELATVYDKHLPVKIKYSDYVHQGTSLRDDRSKVITLSISASRLGLDKRGFDKFCRLAANYYDEKTKMLTLVGDRCLTREQNIDYAKYLLTALYFESRKKDKWEEGMRNRSDDRKHKFVGSSTERQIREYFKGSLPDEKIMRKFGKNWFDYRNQPETPETTRKYEDAVRELLGVKKICQPASRANPVSSNESLC